MINRFYSTLLGFFAAMVVSIATVSPAMAQCAGPADGGRLLFNTDYSVLQYCDGTNWNAMGLAPAQVPGTIIRESVTHTSTGTSETFNMPATRPDGDLYIFLAHSENDNTISAPAGWNTIAGFNGVNDNTMYMLAAWRMGNSEPATYELGGNMSGGLVSVMRFSGVDTSNPINQSAFAEGFSASVNAPAITPTTDGSLIIRMYHTDGEDFTSIPATQWFEEPGPDNSDHAVSFEDGPAEGVSTGGATASLDGADDWGAITVAITPEIVAAQVATTVVPDGLVGHWKLDEIGGTDVIDYASSNNGTMQGGLTGGDSVDGRVGTALDFDGAGDYVDLGDVLDMGGNDFSITAWVRPDAVGNYVIVSKYSDSVDPQYWFYIEPGELRGTIRDSTTLARVRTEEITIQEWQFVVFTVDRSDTAGLKLYRNGEEVSTYLAQEDPTSLGSLDNTAGLRIGRLGNGSRPFDGAIDDVRIYDRALSADEVAQLYEARDGQLRYNIDARVPEFFNGNQWVATGPVQPTETGLVGHWKLDEESGPFVDSSGNGNDGTQSGGIDYASSGIIGNAAGFDGAGDHIIVAASSTLDLTELTISTWLKPSSVLSPEFAFVILENRAGPTDTINYEFVIDGTGNGTPSNDGKLRLTYNNGTYRHLISDTVLQTDIWQHAAVTIDASGNYTFYLDGVADGSGVAPVPLITHPGTTLQIGQSDDAAQNDTYFGAMDDVRIYNRALSAAEIGDLYFAGKPGGTDPCAPANDPAPGQVCDDGSIFAGLSTAVGNPPMYVTDENQSESIKWKQSNGNDDINPVSYTDGELNRANVTVPISELDAMYLCETLDRHSNDDWYLPAIDELSVLYTNRAAIDASALENFNLVNYWSSTENNVNFVWKVDFSDGTQNGTSKLSNIDVRCVRKGYVSRCSNPARPEGTIIFNTSVNVMQYCDGQVWRRIGP